jgi:hypothetical protein
MMKTLKEPQEPFCPPFPLPLSPLSRRPRVAFCAFNQQLFLSFFERFDESVFCPDSLSLSLSLQNNQKESQRLLFSAQKAQKAPLSSTKTVERKISRVFHFFCEHRPDSWHPDKKDTQKLRYLNRN